jgi:exosortase
MTSVLPQFMKQSKALLQIGLISLCLGVLYFTALKLLVAEWIELPDFSHGFLIPFLSLYLLWNRKEKLEQLCASPENAGLAIIILGLVLFLLGNLASETFSTRISLLVVLAGVTLFLLGWPYMKVLLFPIAYLVFMIPIPSILMQKITFPMQLFASSVAEASLQLMGIPVLREGNIIQLPHGTLEVADACSGIRSLMSLLALGVIFAYFTKSKLWHRAVLVLACFPIAIVVNALRVSATGILANYYGLSVAQGFFHGFSGYVLFIVAFLLLLGLGFLLSKVSPEQRETRQD